MWAIIVLLSVGLFNMFQDPNKINPERNSLSFSNFLTNNEYLVRDTNCIDQFNAYQIKVYGSANVINRNNKIRQLLYTKIKSNVSNVQIS